MCQVQHDFCPVDKEDSPLCVIQLYTSYFCQQKVIPMKAKGILVYLLKDKSCISRKWIKLKKGYARSQVRIEMNQMRNQPLIMFVQEKSDYFGDDMPSGSFQNLMLNSLFIDRDEQCLKFGDVFSVRFYVHKMVFKTYFYPPF